MHQRIEGMDGTIHHFYWWPGVWSHEALKLGMGHPLKSMEILKPSSPWEHSSSRNCRTRMRGMGPTIGMRCAKLTIPSTVSTQTGSSQKTGVPNIFIQWVKTPPGSPSMQRQKSLHGFAEIATSSPKVEAPLESTRAPLWMPPPGFTEIASILGRSQMSLPPPAEEQAYPSWWGPPWW